jgi:cellulose synthase/poly-beta-1,6-N-acetylglucosamine synthase-like glycosyltransferase
LTFDNAEIIVIDGRSSDSTVSIAESYNAKILGMQRCRGIQLQSGAKAATGDILWFLHADTRPSPDSLREMKNALEDRGVVGGNFSIYFYGRSWGAKFLTWLYPNLRKIGLIYGDSAIFVRREIYRKMGGFKPFPIFEDVDLVESLKKEGEIVTLQSVVTTSSRRFENKSFILTFLRWMVLQGLY